MMCGLPGEQVKKVKPNEDKAKKIMYGRCA